MPFQDNCQALVLSIEIKYDRQYTFVFSGIVFSRGRNNKNNFLGECVEARLLRIKGTEEHIPKNR